MDWRSKFVRLDRFVVNLESFLVKNNGMSGKICIFATARLRDSAAPRQSPCRYGSGLGLHEPWNRKAESLGAVTIIVN